MKTKEEKTAEIIAKEQKLNENISKYIPFGIGGGDYFNKSVAEILQESNPDDFDIQLESIKAHYIIKVYFDNQNDYIIEFFNWQHEKGKIIFKSVNRKYSDYDLELDLNIETLQLLNEMEEHFTNVESYFEIVNNEFQIKVA